MSSGKYKYHEWDSKTFVLPPNYKLNESSSLADALKVFYAAGGYDFFNVVDPNHYSPNWLHFIGELYNEIANGRYTTTENKFNIPLSEEQKQELAARNVPKVFVTDIDFKRKV